MCPVVCEEGLCLWALAYCTVTLSLSVTQVTIHSPHRYALSCTYFTVFHEFVQGTTKPSGATTVAAKSEAIANAAGEAFDLKKRRALEQLDAKYL